MTLLPDTLLELARQGATVHIDARKLSVNQLDRLAVEAAGSGARLIIRNAQSLTPDHARALARIGGASIEFDAT